MPFPTQVQTQPAPAVAGDFSSANPYRTVNSGQGAFVAGAGLFVGRFAWADPTNTVLNSNFAVGSPPAAGVSAGNPTAPIGFIGRNQQGLITTFLAEASMQILPGIQCVAFRGGDFWAVNSGLLAAQIGMKAYALYSTGLVAFAPTGTPPGSASGSASAVVANTASVTGSIAVVVNPPGTTQPATGNEEFGVLNVTAVGSGTLQPGSALSGTNIQAGTTLGAQLTGTAGAVGTYLVNIPQTVASTTISTTYGTLTVGGTVVAGFGLGTVLSGANITAGSYITGNAANGVGLTGAGGAGTYITQTQTAASAAVNGTTGIETNFSCDSAGQVGELVKITAAG